PLPDEEEAPDVRLTEIDGLGPATVAILEHGGYRMLNDIIDLEREDFLKLPGIAPEEADRIMAMINELTEDGSSADADGASADDAPEEPPVEGQPA
ncbi:MAG TPA: helix-hairpin-helix domain-containing protein, partial [Gemmatimonadaceae bacterium]|nr:helix-hairpin-helix domain-containing protein [Gemmatimonadaceae bacterium]